MKTFLRALVKRILRLEARFVLWRFRPRIVAVTGNIGKTTTKDAIAAALAAHTSVRKSKKSYNSELGVPLTILGQETGWASPIRWLGILMRGIGQCISLKRYPDWLVLEVGADQPGDIQHITEWVIPDVAVVTYISEIPVHIAFYESREQLVQEKAALVRALPKKGTAVLNMDNDDVRAMERSTKANVLFYGMDQSAHIYASHIEYIYTTTESSNQMPRGITFKVNESGNSVPVVVNGALGKQHVYPILAALAVAKTQGLNLVNTADVFRQTYEPPAGRMRLITGVNGSLIIDDSYNSSPGAVSEALQTLETINVPGRRIVILGDMRELGNRSVEAHREVGIHVARTCDLLFTLGDESAVLADAAREANMENVHGPDQWSSPKELGEHVASILREGDVVLVKGSQTMRCEKIVKELMAYPDRAGELLVRQDRYWHT